MDGPTPGIACSSSRDFLALRRGAFMSLGHRMKADTIALAVDELREVAHAIGKRRLGNGHTSARCGNARELHREVLSGAQVHHAACARLVSIRGHDRAGYSL